MSCVQSARIVCRFSCGPAAVDRMVSFLPIASDGQYILFVLEQAHCSNLARNSIGSIFSTSERNIMASSESTQEGTELS